jgi:U4/U6.U5 tri-snRNP component SNU23
VRGVAKFKSTLRPQDLKGELAQARVDSLNLESKIGRVVVVGDSKKQQPGFYCEACDFTCKDNLTYLDHCNSLRHLKNTGKSLNFGSGTVEGVKDRLKLLAEQRQEKAYSLQERVQRAQQEEDETKQRRKENKKQKKASVEEVEVDDEMAALMGFSGFSTTKK